MPSKGELAKAAITGAARDLFYRKGYTATSIADIAAQSGHAKGNIQYHFNTKDDILHAVTEARLGEYEVFLSDWAGTCASARDCLEEFVAMFERNAEDLAQFGCPIGTLNEELGKDHLALQEDTRRLFDTMLAWLEGQFSQILPAERARLAAEHLMVMAQGQALLAHAYRDADIVKRQSRLIREWLEKECTAGTA